MTCDGYGAASSNARVEGVIMDYWAKLPSAFFWGGGGISRIR
jgi:hypothetical protein